MILEGEDMERVIPGLYQGVGHKPWKYFFVCVFVATWASHIKYWGVRVGERISEKYLYLIPGTSCLNCFLLDFEKGTTV